MRDRNLRRRQTNAERAVARLAATDSLIRPFLNNQNGPVTVRDVMAATGRSRNAVVDSLRHRTGIRVDEPCERLRASLWAGR